MPPKKTKKNKTEDDESDQLSIYDEYNDEYEEKMDINEP